jgi:hypothetical protein
VGIESIRRIKSGLLVIYYKSNTDIQTNKKETNMKINAINKQAIHNVVYTDLQRLMFRQYNARTNEFNITDEDYDNAMSQLYRDVYACNSINDINNLLLSYIDLFEGEKIYNYVFTLDGTMNYVLFLLIEHCNIMSEPV